MAYPAGFKRGKPSPLWLVPAYEDVHLVVMALFGMRRVRQTF
jgi:hypothetical protein